MRILRGACLTTAVLLALWASFRWGGWIRVKEIRVIGATHLSPAEVMNLTHIESGANMVRLDCAGAERELSEVPWVKRARVRRVWFRRVVEIYVEERKPVGRVQLEGGETFWVDAEGVILGPADGSSPIAVGVGTTHPGRVPQEVGEILRLYSKFPLCSSIFPTLDLSNPGEVVLRSGDGELTARLNPGTLADVLPLLEELLARVDLGGFSEIDCRLPGEFILKPKTEAGGKG